MSPPQPHQVRVGKGVKEDAGEDQLGVEGEDQAEAVEEDQRDERLVRQPGGEAGADLHQV